MIEKKMFGLFKQENLQCKKGLQKEIRIIYIYLKADVFFEIKWS